MGENRYYSFGETRLATGSMYTDKIFTGQRNIAGLGIYHYQSRFYSPYLNHFTQPDTLVSDPYNPQAWNRYAYVLNNPIRYNDPTGHTSACVGANVDPECNGGSDNWKPQYGVTWWRVHTQLRFGITLSDDGGKDWDEVNAKLIYDSLANIDTALNGQLRSLAGGATFELDEYEPDADCPDCTYGGWTAGTNVTFYTTGNEPIRQMNIYHEFGHLIDSLPGAMNNVFTNALIAEGNPSYVGETGYLSADALVALRVTTDPNFSSVQARQASEGTSAEQWADIFANYLAGNINRNSMSGREMYRFVTDVLALYVGAP